MKTLHIFFVVVIIFVAVDPGMAKNLEFKTLAQETAPKWMMAEHKGRPEIKGMCADILLAIERNSGHITFSWENKFYPVKRMLSFLEKGMEVQLIVSMARNAERERKFIYSKPLYEVHHVMAVRRDDPIRVSSFKDVAKLGQSGIILTVFGTATSKFLKARPENLIIHEGYTPKINLSQLLQGRGRFFYYYDFGVHYAIGNGGFQDTVKVLPVTFRTYEHYIIYSKTVPQPVIDEIDRIIDGMKKSGEMDGIRKKYL